MTIEWKVIPGCDAGEPYCVQAFIGGKASYKVAQNLPIEDAAIISAAPDLLAALEAIVRFDNGEISIARGNYENIIAAARAAIKKARGEA